MATPLFATSPSTDSGPVLAAQPVGIDPSRSMLAQILAGMQNNPPRTADAALKQGLASAIANGTMGLLARKDAAEREDGARQIAAIMSGQPLPPKTESPGLLQRAANWIGIGGDDKATPTPANSGQMASLTPGNGSGAAPTAPATTGPLSQRQQLAAALSSSNPYVQAFAMNRLVALQDAQEKANLELDKEFATKGLRRVANADGD